MASQVRITGSGMALYDPQNDVWHTPHGPSKVLTIRCLFNDAALAFSAAEKLGRAAELVAVPVILTLDVNGSRVLDRAYQDAHPDKPAERSLFKGG